MQRPSAEEALQRALECVQKEFANVPDNDEMVAKISTKFKTTFESPPINDFEAAIGKRFSSEEVNVALFQPLEEQIPHYVKVLSLGCGQPAHHPLSKVTALLLSLIFLVHRRHWSFLKEFIIQGGLQPLVLMIDTENLYSRGQVLETLLSCTDCDVYDWFAPPEQLQHKQLHARLLESARQPSFFPKLFSNRTDSYPGGSFRALQLIAFSLSWIRALYTADQNLQLSEAATAQLRLWAKKDHLQNGLDDAKGEKVEEPEEQLANALFDDFCGGKNSDAAHAPTPPHAGSNELVIMPVASGTEVEIHRALQSGSVTAHECSNAPSLTQPTVDYIADVESLKEEGNAAFKKMKYLQALRCYKAAIQQATGDAQKDSAVIATLHVNAATTCWKLSERTRASTAKPDDERAFIDTLADLYPDSRFSDVSENEAYSEKLLQCCIEECTDALRFEPLHYKATYRLASTHLLLGRPNDALQSILCVLNDSNSDSLHVDDKQLLIQLQRRCLAALILSEKHREGLREHLQRMGFLDRKTAEILSALLKQSQIELDISSLLPTTTGGGRQISANSADVDSSTAVSSTLAEMLLEEDQRQRHSADLPAKAAPRKAKKSKKGGAAAAKSSTTAGNSSKKVKAANPKALQHFSLLKNDARQLGNHLDTNWSDRTPQAEAAVLDILATAHKHLRDFWSAGGDLASGFACSLEDEQVLLLLAVAVEQSHAFQEASDFKENPLALEAISDAVQIVWELNSCERIGTVLQLAFLGTAPDSYSAVLRQRAVQFLDLYTSSASGAALLDAAVQLRGHLGCVEPIEKTAADKAMIEVMQCVLR